MDWPSIIQLSLIVLIVAGLGGVIYVLSTFAGDKNNLNDVQRNMGIITAVTSVMVLLLGVLSYLFIRINPQVFVTLVLILLFLNLEISLIAVSASVLQKI